MFLEFRAKIIFLSFVNMRSYNYESWCKDNKLRNQVQGELLFIRPFSHICMYEMNAFQMIQSSSKQRPYK